jgi:hypothetical protein
MWGFQDRQNNDFFTQTIEMNDHTIRQLLIFGHRDDSCIKVGMNTAFLVDVHEIDLTLADNFISMNHFTLLFFELELE